MDRPVDELAVLRALADPNRFRLFTAVRAKERCVRDLVDSEGLAQPLVSHHLRVLADAGLVQARRADGFSLYSVDPAGMAAARDALDRLLDPDRLAAMALPGGNPDCCRED
ncbi:MAG TPA: metalloregulator ArsR/SmtB family transcription factor [Acidimicrobiales bacterium]|nr:metalloregulator ArsR/SmtB family transcription factor [Acidimicrobiales bacterium]